METDFQLIKKARDGDSVAFETLLYRYDRHVLNIAASFRNNEEDAKDIYQEVFLRVYKGLKNFQFRSEFSTWLFRVTTNVCITYENKKKKYNHDSLDKNSFDDDENSAPVSEYISSESFSDSKVLGNETREKINKAVETLPAKQKMAFTLKYFQGLKIKEIAEMMNSSEGTIKRYLFTSTNKMRDLLKDLI